MKKTLESLFTVAENEDFSYERQLAAAEKIEKLLGTIDFPEMADVLRLLQVYIMLGKDDGETSQRILELMPASCLASRPESAHHHMC